MEVSEGMAREGVRYKIYLLFLRHFYGQSQFLSNFYYFCQVEAKSLHASMASLAQSHHQHHAPNMPHHHRMVLGENG